ncbi:MAG: CHASE domain-containing protein [Salinivirgaceae bacterium]
MKSTKNTNPPARPSLFVNIKSLVIFLLSLTVTLIFTVLIKQSTEKSARQNFELICAEIQNKIDVRLKAHAQLLRSGAAYFTASDTVTRQEWMRFNESENIDANLPGIQGVGFALWIPKEQLATHIQTIRNSGFPDYKITPEGERENYTSILYLEPFEGRNLSAFGYDMFSNPIRRKAMEIARDSNLAALSGKVILVQETNEDIQAGTLMYVPVYKYGKPIDTKEQKQAAIVGWVYSPYRMNDLMTGILGERGLPDKNRIRLKIYDGGTLDSNALLYSTHKEISYQKEKAGIKSVLPIDFNGTRWTLVFESHSSFLNESKKGVWIIAVSGIAISLLLLALSIAYFRNKERMQQILYLNKQLEVLVADKDRFISILSHDLRSPFSALLGFTQLLQQNFKTYTQEQIESQLKMINDSAERIFSLLDNILMWNRSQAGKMVPKPKVLSCSALVSGVIENLKLIALSKNIELIQNTPQQLKVVADMEMTNTILRNLISNAIKFSHPEGRVSIKSEAQGDMVLFTVSDTGVGIAPEIRERLFNSDDIYTTPGTSNEKGTGFGLLLCKEFVEQNGGKIWVESETGKGSSFKFTLKKNTV